MHILLVICFHYDTQISSFLVDGLSHLRSKCSIQSENREVLC